jgi:transcriptional antiterminator RfaH
MPILPLEPFLFPADLLSGSQVSDTAEWWVLHTRPRAEKALVRSLRAHGDAFFLPLHERRTRSRGRTLASYVPLFPGYVFLYGDAQARLHALESNLVAQTLKVYDQAQLYGDLVRVNRLIASGAPLEAEERLEPGTRVEITAGPFAGVEGKIIRRNHRLTLLVEVNFLQRGASVEIESWMIQRLGDSGPTRRVAS